MSFRTGDSVLHRPSGEKWLVAWADAQDVICCGWPESRANAADCELVRAATDEQHWKLVTEVAKSGPGPRASRCQTLLEELRVSNRVIVNRMPMTDGWTELHLACGHVILIITAVGEGVPVPCPQCLHDLLKERHA